LLLEKVCTSSAFFGIPYARFPPPFAPPSIWKGKNCPPCFFSCRELYCIGGLLCHPTSYLSALAAGLSKIFSHRRHCHHGALVIHVILWCFGLIFSIMICCFGC
jgi:hypothetical protein